MRSIRLSIFVVLAGLSCAPAASAQLLAAKDGPVVYGHHHLNVTSLDAHRKFWIDTLGGTPVKLGTIPNDIVMFPNVEETSVRPVYDGRPDPASPFGPRRDGRRRSGTSV